MAKQDEGVGAVIFIVAIGAAVWWFAPSKSPKPGETGQLFTQPLKMEVKLSGNGQSLKYWTDSNGDSGGERSWKLPLKDVTVEVNITRGAVSISATRFPLLKIGASLSGEVTLNFSPSIGGGGIGLGMNLEVARLDGGKFLGLERPTRGVLSGSALTSTDLTRDGFLKSGGTLFTTNTRLKYEQPGKSAGGLLFDPGLPQMGLAIPKQPLWPTQPGTLGSFQLEGDKLRLRAGRLLSNPLTDGLSPIQWDVKPPAEKGK